MRPIVFGRWIGWMLVALVLGGGGGSKGTGQPPEPSPEGVEKSNAAVGTGQPPEPFPAPVEQAWTAAGAEVGWLQPLKEIPGISEFVRRFVRKEEGQPGDLPAFRFRTWSAGLLEKLPAPDVPFGLDLSFMRVTDAGLKELAGLKSLQVLDLSFTRVTDAGVAELQKALPNCHIIR